MRRFPGLQTSQCEDGAGAVAAVRAALPHGGFDLICLDASMPVMDGYEAAALIRDMGFGGLVLGVTGNALAVDQARFVAAGVNAVITKPVSMDALVAAVAEFQVRYRARAGPAAARPNTPAPGAPVRPDDAATLAHSEPADSVVTVQA
jgi:CheY-like chemotaxis protein